MKYLKAILIVLCLCVNISYVIANNAGKGDYATKKYSVIPPTPEVLKTLICSTILAD